MTDIERMLRNLLARVHRDVAVANAYARLDTQSAPTISDERIRERLKEMYPVSHGYVFTAEQIIAFARVLIAESAPNAVVQAARELIDARDGRLGEMLPGGSESIRRLEHAWDALRYALAGEAQPADRNAVDAEREALRKVADAASAYVNDQTRRTNSWEYKTFRDLCAVLQSLAAIDRAMKDAPETKR